MADFLDNLAARALGRADLVLPRPATRFEPAPALAWGEDVIELEPPQSTPGRAAAPDRPAASPQTMLAAQADARALPAAPLRAQVKARPQPALKARSYVQPEAAPMSPDPGKAAAAAADAPAAKADSQTAFAAPPALSAEWNVPGWLDSNPSTRAADSPAWPVPLSSTLSPHTPAPEEDTPLAPAASDAWPEALVSALAHALGGETAPAQHLARPGERQQVDRPTEVPGSVAHVERHSPHRVAPLGPAQVAGEPQAVGARRRKGELPAVAGGVAEAWEGEREAGADLPLPPATRRAVSAPREVARPQAAPTPPQISVTIGRIEVRAVGAPPRAAPTARPASGASSLDDYLRKRGERR